MHSNSPQLNQYAEQLSLPLTKRASVPKTPSERNQKRLSSGLLGQYTNEDVKLIFSLLSQGADPNYADEDDNFPIWIAIQMQNAERVVVMLLKKGADVYKSFHSSNEFEHGSVLDLALKIGNALVVKMLLLAGASTTEVGQVEVPLYTFAKLNDFAALAMETMSRHMRDAIEDGCVETVRSLLDNHFPADAHLAQGKTALYVLVESKQPCLQIAQLLCERGADVNFTIDSTPLAVYLLLRQNSRPLLELLCEYGLDPLRNLAEDSINNRKAARKQQSSIDKSETLLEFAIENSLKKEYIDILRRQAQSICADTHSIQLKV